AAFGTTCPCGSVIVPRIVPRNDCAKPDPLKPTRNRNTKEGIAAKNLLIIVNLAGECPSCVAHCQRVFTNVLSGVVIVVTLFPWPDEVAVRSRIRSHDSDPGWRLPRGRFPLDRPGQAECAARHDRHAARG